MSASRITERRAACELQASISPEFGASFDVLATAPKGVAKLRELILSLAVRGKLLGQKASDIHISDVLHRVKAAKGDLLASRVIKTRKPLPIISVEDAPFDLPDSWRWVALAELCSTLTDGDHLPPPKADDGVPFLVIGDVRSGRINLETASRFVPRSYFEKLDWSRRPMTGDILYTTVGSYGIPIPVVIDQDFCFQRHIALFRPALGELQGYLALVLASPFVFAQATAGATGIAQKTVPLSAMRSFKIPLPPLAEQARIVARVEELMKLCDALEAHGRLQDEQHARLVAILFDALAASESADALAENWKRIAIHFDLLLDRPEAVDTLDQIILELAIRGLLVPQEVGDEPARLSLELIHSAKEQIVASEKTKRRATKIQIADVVETVADLPEGWEWASLSELVTVLNGRAYAKQELLDAGTPVLRVGNLFTSKHWYYSNLKLEDEKYCDTGDLLFAWSASFGPFIWGGPKAIYHYHIWKLSLHSDTEFYKDYLYTFLLKKTREMKASSHGVSMLHITKEAVEKIAVPIPPLAEQHRIVARVKQLRRLCTDLRERLQQARATQSQLADALVSAAAQSPSC